MKDKKLVLFSGGPDSLTLAMKMLQEGYDVHGLTIRFDNGRYKNTEVEFAEKLANHLGIPHTIVDMSPLAEIYKGSHEDLVFVIGGTTSHCTDDGGGDSYDPVVPPLSMEIMLLIASQAAMVNGVIEVYWGIHDDDFHPDITEAMLSRRRSQIEGVVSNYSPVEIVTPFVGMSKKEVFQLGSKLAEEFSLNLLTDTYSCSSGTGSPCGKCRQCRLRVHASEPLKALA